MSSITASLGSRSQLVALARRGRLLRLELRHSTMILLLPLIAVLFYLAVFQPAVGNPPIWFVRSSFIPDQLVPYLSLFAAGIAAWTGSREGRRKTVDLVTTAARPRWVTALASFGATTIWTLAAFLGCVAFLYGVTATQTRWGGPPWWPVAAGAAVLLAFCALGFAAGMLVPGRFTAPLVAFASFLVLVASFRILLNESHPTYALLSPGSSPPNVDAGLFFPYLPDLYIVQTMFFVGVAIAILGGLGLAKTSDSRVAWRGAAVLTAVGLAAAGTGVRLIGTARVEANGVAIPAVHAVASDRPISYTPVCQQATIPICVHPALRAYLRSLSAALDPLLQQVAGLPGAPVRIEQSPSRPGRTVLGASATLNGSPAVLDLAINDLSRGSPNWPRWMDAEIAFVSAVIGGGSGNGAADPAQTAIEAALLDKVSFSKSLGPSANAAARRFAALAPSARRAWLATHLVALRSGDITLAQLP